MRRAKYLLTALIATALMASSAMAANIAVVGGKTDD